MMYHNHSNCQEILGRLNDFIDGELDPELCALLERHMESCNNCQIVYNTLKKTIELCQKDGKRTTLPPDVRGRLFKSLGLEDNAREG